MIITLLLLQHHEEQQRAMRMRQQLASFPFTSQPVGHDVAVFNHLTARFTHAVPGRAQLTPPLAAHGEPATDAVLWMYDVPLAIRYRCEGQAVGGATATDVAVESGKRFAQWRAQKPIELKPVSSEWCMTWRADGGAWARYDLPAPDSTGANREDLILLVRAGMVMHVTMRFPKNGVDLVTLASLRGFMWSTILWEPVGMTQSPWPASAFLEPRVAATLVPGRHEQSAHLGARMQIPRADQNRLEPALLGMIEGKGRTTIEPSEDPFDVPAAPWAPATHEMLTAHANALCTALPHPELRLFLDGTLPHVRTVHDLRGVALMLGRAVKTQA
jgi:hypothetical protein